MEKLNSEQVEKIFTLFNNGDPVNDRLVFEIIKQLEDAKIFYFPLICLCIIIRDRDLKKRILHYLKPNLNKKQEEYINNFESGGVSYSGLVLTLFDGQVFPKAPRGSVLKSNIEDFFTKKEIGELIYFHTKRNRKYRGYDFFHYNDDESNHPKRIEILDHYINSKDSQTISVPCLYKDEIEYLFNKKLSEKRNRILGLEIADLKTDELPSNVLNYPLDKLILFGKSKKGGLVSLPLYLQKFKSIPNLTLNIENEKVIPKDWSQFGIFESIYFWCRGECVFTNFDFIETISGLRSVSIQGGILNHPDMLLHKSEIKITFWNIEFLSVEGYPIEKKKYKKFGFGLAIIKILNFPLEQKRKLLTKVLKKRDGMEEMEVFTEDYIQMLLDTQNYQVRSLIMLDRANRKIRRE